MTECISIWTVVISKDLIGLFGQHLRECLWEVLQETNEIPTYGKQTYGIWKASNGKVYE